MKKLLIAIIIVLIVSFVGLNFYVNNMEKPVDSENTSLVTFEIPAGSSTNSIADVLYENKLIKSKFVFKLNSKRQNLDGTYKAGTYRINGNLSMSEIMIELNEGNVLKNVVKFTVPEGYDIKRLTELLESKGLINKENFLDVVANGDFDYKFLKGLDNNEARLEGFLFPDTYEVYANATEEDIITKMLNRFDELFIDEYYDEAEKMGMTINEVIALASIIEREGLIDSERSTISSVFHNRLEIGMALQSCATVQYILGEQKAVLSTADTRIKSDYNTYLNPGLPPGPIASPGIESIKAALNPKSTSYFYFLAKGDGSHVFSKTYDEHLINKRKYIGE